MKKEITYEELQAAASYVQARLPYTPKVALVLARDWAILQIV